MYTFFLQWLFGLNVLSNKLNNALEKMVFFLYRLKICVYLYKDRFDLDRVDLNFVSFYNKSNYLLDIKRKKIFNHIASLFATRYTLYSNNKC